MTEEWRTLIYQGELFDTFEVSNYGRLRNVNTGTVYRTNVNCDTGYEQVCVSLGSRDKQKLFRIHRCVAETFIDNPEHKKFINHIDGCKTNNNVENLEWVTPSENSQHAWDIGLRTPLCGVDNPAAKLTENDVQYIRKHYISRDREFGARALARKFNIYHSTILCIVNNKRYTNII